MYDLIKCLIHSKLWSGKRTGRDILESEYLFLLVLRSLDDPYHSSLDELYKPHENQCVDEIEEGMKH